MDTSKHLKGKFTGALAALLITLLAMTAATYAWYVYNTSRHTTNVRMAAGAGVSLQISNEYNGTYGYSTVLDSFTGTLNPVSTNRIQGGFQKVFGFTNGSENQPNLVASLFGAGDTSDYYMTTLYLRTNGDKISVYLADIGYEDNNAKAPISTAIRVGFVVHAPGQNQKAEKEFIFEISQEDNPEAEYNTATGKEGYVLDAAKTDGTTVPFAPYTSANYCEYNKETGETKQKDGSVELFQLEGTGSGSYGTPVQCDVYIWLEGCDKDCTRNLNNMTLKNVALSFAGC